MPKQKEIQNYIRFVGHLVLFEVETPDSKEETVQTVAMIVREVVARRNGVFLRGVNLKRVTHPSHLGKALRDYSVERLRTHITDLGRIEDPRNDLKVIPFPNSGEVSLP